jgi:hypothetical protein
MPRIRTIKPEILSDERTAGLSDTAFRLFASCIVLADDYGNLRFVIGQLRGQIWWSSKPAISLDLALAELCESGLLSTYQDAGQSYAHICGWAKNQKVDRPGRHQVPPPGDDSRDSRVTHARVSRGSRENSRDSREGFEHAVLQPKYQDSRDSRVTHARVSRGLATEQDREQDQEGEGSAGEPGRESSPSPESGQAENLTPPGKFDPGIGSNFAAGCLLAGYTVCPSNFAWKDLSAAAVAHWPSEKWPEKRQKLEAAAQRWAAGCDEFTRKSGYKHQAFVAWLNAGNAIDRNEIERLRTERSIAEQKIKRAAYELEKAAAAAQDIEDARLRSLGLPDSWAGLVPT